MAPLNYRPLDPEQVYPAPEVTKTDLASWEANPMSRAALAEIHRLRHRAVQEALRGDEDKFWLRKGKVAMCDEILGALEQLGAEIQRGNPTEPPEEEEDA